MSLTDWVTERVLSGIRPDIIELGTHSFRKLKAKVAKGRLKIFEVVTTAAPESLIFTPHQGFSVFDADEFKRALLKLYGGRIPSSCYAVIIIPDGAFHAGIATIQGLTSGTNPLSLLHREIQDTAPLPVTEYVITHEVTQARGAQREVLYCALPRQVIPEIEALLGEVGIIPVSIQPSFISLSGLLSVSGDDQTSDPSVWIHFGHESTTVAITRSKFLRRVQILPIGAVDLTNAIMKGFSVEKSISEKYKRDEIILIDDPLAEAQREIQSYCLLEPLFATILQKIHGVIQVHSLQSPKEAAFRRIVVSGGGSCLKNFDKLISSNLGIPVFKAGQCMDFFDDVKLGDIDQRCCVAPLIGACFRESWKTEHFEKVVA